MVIPLAVVLRNSQDCFRYIVFFVLFVSLCVLPYEAENYPFKICEELFLNFDVDYIESLDYF